MKIKTNTLTGPALDWMVWVCAGGAEAYPKLKGKAFLRAWRSNSSKYLNPSTEWAQCGPIIERMHISIDNRKGEPCCAFMGTPAKHTFSMFAPEGQPLIAACRCYVASEMGDEVDVPEELCHEV